MKLTILSFTVVAFACIGQTPAEASKSGLRASTEISPYSGSVSVCELADEFSEECLGPIVTEDIEVTEEEESPEEENDAGRNLGIMTGKVCSMIDLNLSKRFDRHSSSWQSYQLPLPVTSNDHYKFYVMSTGFSATFCRNDILRGIRSDPNKGVVEFLLAPKTLCDNESVKVVVKPRVMRCAW
eukprot:CAMPEP_0178517642 /NCGR_PEP_ID=MMETSP0696-20121128/25806_1 /TAXON_ID=265572 /ORGANISM="Extubocellulus spinifer, Strain CCMP396" /LENGTH=182 /DNA_ID=CAMNT_0020148099 /DNA_START=49 /DNA_END=597 /DNA_ORIENTATION=-